MSWIIGYLICGVALGEGLLFDCKRRRQRPDPFEYVVAVFLGPAIVPFILLKNLIWRKHK